MGDEEQGKISIISEGILCDKRLTPSEKMVYARICYFKEFFESAEATAEYLGLKIWTVRSAKRKLEQLGYIFCVKNTGSGKRYVADINREDVGENNIRCWKKQHQTLEKTTSDVGKNNIRCWKNQHIDKNISKNIGKNVSKKEKVDSKQKVRKFEKPTLEQVQAYCTERKNQVNAEAFIDFYESKGWVVGKSPMKNWKAAVRTWERNGYGKQANKSKPNENKELYQPADGEDISYKAMFDKWKRYLGTSLQPTREQVEACRDLISDIGEESLERLIVALRMRSETNFVTRELKAIQDFKGLADNRSLVMGFYNEHRTEWQLKQKQAQTGKKPWEL